MDLQRSTDRSSNLIFEKKKKRLPPLAWDRNFFLVINNNKRKSNNRVIFYEKYIQNKYRTLSLPTLRVMINNVGRKSKVVGDLKI